LTAIISSAKPANNSPHHIVPDIPTALMKTPPIHALSAIPPLGVRHSPRYPLYSTTKAAVNMPTRALGGALAPHGIHINAIALGNTATALNAAERADAGNAALMVAKAAATPSGRVYSPPEDMAAATLFLCAGEVNAMHGATMLLDGGMSSCV
jgi:NAD(P)-dependent dehydrogenase (short-subunit alcohol dehydrogenase family)